MSEEMKELEEFRVGNDEKEEQKNISDFINKIMNTLSFRKLAGKTQVILSLTGPDIRTRLTHTIEVARIAKDVCRDLHLNEALAEAIALSHDIGHTPFGHVGERTLREIMCGCDTLGDKVQDLDFNNSGFKHNLQSFRVLEELECIIDSCDKYIWPYILWGVAVHTKMSYSKPYSGMENEIFISCKHCEWVFSCHFHKEHKCKRNDARNNNKRDEKPDSGIEHSPKERICKPWYCAKLTEEDWEKGDKSIFCEKKACYMAKIWKNKIENKLIYSKFRYLFDHPFPNIFYASYLNRYFSGENGKVDDWVSVEAQVVRQADEIAQRQQDLEDGISKGLIPISEAKKIPESVA